MTVVGVSSLDRLLAELAPAVELVGGAPLTRERLRVLLGRVELRAWQLEGDSSAPGPLAGRCPLGSGRALLASTRALPDRAASGAYVVARSLPVGPGRWVLLGRPSVVGAGGASRFEQLLRSLRAPPGEFWRVHGGVLAHAARAA